MNINIEFDAQALAAPATFRSAVLVAASIIDAALSDNITINIKVGYGEFNGSTLPNQTGAEGNTYYSDQTNYIDVRAALISHASPGDPIFNALPVGSIGGLNAVFLFSSEEKALGIQPLINPSLDGVIGIGTRVPTSLLVGVALHEIGHAMGRVPVGPMVMDVFDFFRFTSPGVQLLAGGNTAPPAYFSIDGGVTDLADYGQTSDPSDFLNNSRTPGDAFDEFYNFSTLQALTPLDLEQFDALGFNLNPTPTSRLDFNSNGRSDVLWRQNNGPLAVWDMAGGPVASSFVTSNGAIVAPDASWSVAAITDFDGDHKADVLWRNASGLLADWFMNGSQISGSGYLNVNGTPIMPDPSWNIAGIGDLNGDGESDLLWRDTSGSTAVWVMNGSSIVGSGYLNVNGTTIAPDPTWSVAGMGDFNGDKYSDLIWRNSVTGELAEWQLHSSDIIGSADLNAGGVAIRPDASWSIIGVGDFNGDGNADLLWRNTNGTLSEWLMHGSTVIDSSALTYNGTAVNAPANWQVVEIGDFNGDRNSDILWRNTSTGQLSEWLMLGNVLGVSTTTTAGGTTVTPDLSWTTQGKPTNFA
jgi:hypothetical protein